MKTPKTSTGKHAINVPGQPFTNVTMVAYHRVYNPNKDSRHYARDQWLTGEEARKARRGKRGVK